MKRPVRPPRFLPEVLEAIYELRETRGSRSSKILSHIKSTRKHVNSFSLNLSTQVNRALKHAVNNGFVKQRCGKFTINTDMLDPYKGCAECKRRKRMERARRRRRRKHRQHSRLDSDFSSDSERYMELVPSDSDSDDVPVRQVRRRRRKGKQRRRRRRRSVAEEKATKAVENNDENLVEELRSDMVYPNDHMNADESMQDSCQCDNPECLCKVKDEIEDSPDVEPQA